MSIIYELLLKEEKALLKKLEEVRAEISKFTNESISAIEYIASTVSEPIQTPTPNHTVDEINGFSIPQKMLLALKDNERFMKIREIAEYISQYTNEDIDSLVRQLSRRTKYLKEKGKITKHQVGKSKKNTFWGSTNWIDSKGNIKEGYEYNDESVDDNQTFLIEL